MTVIKCQKCKTEFEVDEKEASWKKICLDCFRKQPAKSSFKKASEVKTNGREDCIMRQVALKCLAMQNDMKFNIDDELTVETMDKANKIVEYMKNG